jgi:hypothetical protein
VDSSHARLDEGIRAWRRSSLVPARLERDHGGRAARRFARSRERIRFGVWRARAAMKPLGDEPPVRLEQHATDARVGPERHARRRSQLERALHRFGFGQLRAMSYEL